MYQTCTRFGFGPDTQADRIWLAYYPQFAKVIVEERRHQETQRSIEQARRDGLLQAINEEKLDPDYFDDRSTQRYSFDHTPCRVANEEDLEKTLLDNFFEQPRVLQRRAQSAETFSEWQSSKLWRNHYPTYGALLCFGKYPQRWLPGARTHCIRWEGNEQDTILDRQDLDGSLLAQYERIFNFLQAHLRITRSRSRQKDSDQWEIPFPALREAIANALIHRDYPKRDDGVYIELFDDRIEVTNPGVFPMGTSAETFMTTGTQGRYTNPLIADVFYLAGYVEQVGSGLRKMNKEMEQAGLEPPEFLENKDSGKLKVILHRPKLPVTSSEPLPAFQVPYPPNPLFLGRNAELQQLSSALLGEGSKIAAVLPAIAGIGGIGKTQLASEFAHRYRNDFPGGVFWLNMAQTETVAAQVAAAGGPEGLDLPGWSELDFEAKVVAVRRAWNEPVRRLIVFNLTVR